MHQRREAPARHAPVELNPRATIEAVPKRGTINVDEIVCDEVAIAFEGLFPVDVPSCVPLIELRLLVEPAQISVLAVVVVPKIGSVSNLDLVSAFHRRHPPRLHFSMQKPSSSQEMS